MAPRRMTPRVVVPSVLLLTALSCTVFAPPTRVTVLHTTTADHTLREEGTNLNVDHWLLEGGPPGLEKGFFVVKSELEWHQHWPTTDTDKVPILPADLNFAKEMLFVMAPPDRNVVSTELRTVVVNEGGIHAYVTETVPGVDCPLPDKDAKVNYDLARVPLVDGKDVQFHIETTPGDSCGTAPQAKITCRPVLGGAKEAQAPFVDSLHVDPGTKVSCIVGSFTSPRPVIDLTWTFAGLPLGATAKMGVGARGTAVSFTPDVFGRYDLQVEVLDDLQRRGTSSTEVTVDPKGPLVLQMVWTKFDPDDDPSTFPRIELATMALHDDGSVVGAPAWRAPKKLAPKRVLKKGSVVVVEATAASPLPGTPGAPPITWGKATGCSLASTAAYCKAEAMGFTTVLNLDPGAAKLYAVGVHFTDDRVQGQAVPCVRSYRSGKLVSDLCDTTPHTAESWWQVGVFDSETGKTVQTLAAERAQAEAKAAADAKVAAEAKAALDAKAAADARAAAASARAAAAGPTRNVHLVLPTAGATVTVGPPGPPRVPVAPPVVTPPVVTPPVVTPPVATPPVVVAPVVVAPIVVAPIPPAPSSSAAPPKR